MVYRSQNENFHEVKRERDLYKKEAECLKSHLRDVKRYANGNAYRPKPNTHNYKKDFNKGHPETSKRETTAHNQKQFTEKRSYGNSRGENSRGFGQNNTQQLSQNTQQPSSWFGLWGFSSSSSSSSSNVKNNYNGSSNSRGSSGRGNYSHSRGRGGGRGNGRGRGLSHQ
ncbi:hypothetical protein R5R35_013569 [Gryllus longicercus]